MSYRVGVPKGLGYYYLYPFMKGFLETLGAEVVLSPNSGAKTLEDMRYCPTDEPCVSVKLYYAHTKALLEQNIDYLFVPVLSSLERDNFCCPKLIGCAAMVRNGLHVPADRILSPEVNERERPGLWRTTLAETAASLGVHNRAAVAEAVAQGRSLQRRFEQLTTGGMTTVEAYRVLDGRSPTKRTRPFDRAAEYDEGQNIAIMGHPYMLYDLVGQSVVDRLREYGRVITFEMVPWEKSKGELASVFEGEKMWTYEARLLAASYYLLRHHLADKLILVGAFECGPESVLEAFIEREAERQGVPFMLLTLDEHSGEAGLVTRLEAFVDTARSRGRDGGPGPTAPEPQRFGGAGRSEETQTSHWLQQTRRGPEPSGLVLGTPSMGYLDIALRAVFEECNVQSIRTPPMSKLSVELGKELAPEFMCYPLITTMGQIRESLDKGANMILMVGGKGRCRLGWYAQVQQILLQRLGYDFDLVIIDSPVPLKTNWQPFVQAVKKAINGASWRQLVKGLYFGYQKMASLDAGDALLKEARAYERVPGTADRAFKKFVRRVDRAATVKEVRRVMADFKEEVRAIEREETHPLRVRLVGEIYCLLESFVNQNIEALLGQHLQPRVLVERELSATTWFDENILRRRKLHRRHQQVVAAARPYLEASVGGHGLESVGLTVLSGREGYDGVIHLLPFTCMPEIVAQNVLAPLSAELDIPVISLIVSEQMGEAGFITRVEAFLDLLEERRWAKTG